MYICKLLNTFQNKVITFLDELSDEALKKEATSEAKSDTFSVIMKVHRVRGTVSHEPPSLPPSLSQSLRHLCRRVPAREDIESFRLKMILRLVAKSLSGTVWIT